MLYEARRFKNRWIYEVLPDGAWKDKPCFIIGGGPSLADFDFSLLKGHRTIGVNRVFEKFDPTVIFSMDTRFLNWIEKGVYEQMPDGQRTKDLFHKSKAYKVWLCTYPATLSQEIFIIRAFQNYTTSLKAFKWTMRDGIGHGNNSGYGALNFAVCLGANPIYLLGFDMKYSEGKSHWHSGHPVKQPESKTVSFITYFNRAAQFIRTKKDLRVINLNPDSGLNCFPKMHHSEVLN